MGERQNFSKKEDGSTTHYILISEQERDKLYSDAELIRNTYIENNSAASCMNTELIYNFLLGVYVREETDGEYETTLNERLEYSRGQSQ